MDRFSLTLPDHQCFNLYIVIRLSNIIIGGSSLLHKKGSQTEPNETTKTVTASAVRRSPIRWQRKGISEDWDFRESWHTIVFEGRKQARKEKNTGNHDFSQRNTDFPVFFFRSFPHERKEGEEGSKEKKGRIRRQGRKSKSEKKGVTPKAETKPNLLDVTKNVLAL